MLPFGLLSEVSANALTAGLGLTGSAAPGSAGNGASSPFASLLEALGSLAGGEAVDGEGGGFDLSSLGVGDDVEALAGAEGIVIPPALAQLFQSYGIDLTGDVGAAVADALAANGGADVSGDGATAPKATAGTPGADGLAPQVPNAVGGGVASSNAANAAPAAVAQPVVPGIDVTANGGVDAGKFAANVAGSPVPGVPLGGQGLDGAEKIVVPAEVAGTDTALNVEAKASAQAGAVDQTASADPEVGADKAAAAAVAKAVAEPKPRRFQSELPEEVRAPALRNGAVAENSAPAQKPADADALTLEQRILLTSEQTGKAAVQGAGQDNQANQANQAKNAAVPSVADDKASSVAKQVAAAFAETDGGAAEDAAQQTKADAEKAAGKNGAVAAQAETVVKTVKNGVPANSATAAVAPQAKQQLAAQAGDAPSVEGDADFDPDAVDPGEVDPATGKTKSRTANASSESNGPAPAGAARSAVSDGRNVAAAAVEAASSGEVVDIDGEPDGDLSLALHLRNTGQVADMAAGRAQALQHAPTQAQAGHVAMQVATAIERNLQNGNTRFQMRFDPPELGRVDVHLKVGKDGKVQAHLVVDRPETLDLFMRDQRGLERALQSAGLQPDGDNLSFSLNDQGGQQSAFSQGEQHHRQGGQADTPTPFDIAEIIDSQAQQATLAKQRGGLDIRI